MPVPEDSIIESNPIKDHKEIVETLGGAEHEVRYTPTGVKEEDDQKQELKDEKYKDEFKEQEKMSETNRSFFMTPNKIAPIDDEENEFSRDVYIETYVAESRN